MDDVLALREGAGAIPGFTAFNVAVGMCPAYPETPADQGDEIVVRWTARGTNTGDYFGMPATGKPIEITGMNTWNVRDGKAIEGWVNRDDMLMMQQLGVVPAPG